MRRIALVVLTAAALGGCFTSHDPLIPDDVAVTPFGRAMSFQEIDADGNPTGSTFNVSLMPNGLDYSVSGNNPVSGSTVRLAELTDDGLIAQITRDDGELYAVLRPHLGHWDYYLADCLDVNPTEMPGLGITRGNGDHSDYCEFQTIEDVVAAYSFVITEGRVRSDRALSPV